MRSESPEAMERRLHRFSKEIVMRNVRFHGLALRPLLVQESLSP